ncbi:MAG: hypothetical protein ABJ242_09080 [Marinomonas sp.]
MNDLPHSGLTERVAELKKRTPDLRAEVLFYALEDGGRKTPVPSGIGFPCKLTQESSVANDAAVIFDRNWVDPGNTAIADFYFLLGEEAAGKFRSAGKFYLWEAGIVAEAIVLRIEE